MIARWFRAQIVIQAVLLLLITSAAAQQPTETRPARYDAGMISGLPARNIGSAAMSGRVAAVTAVNDSGRLTVFAGAASGGVWKSVNSGTTFKPVFDKEDVQSIGAITIDPSNPKIVWVGTGEAWTRNSTSVGDGIYKSTDGGENWTNVGLRDSERISRIIVDPKDGNNVLACALGHLWNDNEERGVYKTSDGGKTWTKLDASQFMVWRPFYFGNLIVDPKNENKIFKPDLILLLSVNGGRSFSGVSGGAHGDFHDVWIDPNNPNTLFAGDDGGLWRSIDGGTRWEHMFNLPVSQFYHVSVDNADPYHDYGGLQDNSSWVGDSSYPGGVRYSRWENMYGGHGFWTWEDPSDPDYLYAESQGGEIGRVNRHTLEARAIKPYPNYGEKKLRCNWNTPIMVSPNDKNTLYFGCQFLFRSTDHGQSWARISPDLSTNNPEKQKQEESGGVTVDNSAAEMNTTVYSISESPKNGQVIWVGTDDGNVQVTRDGGKNWTNVADNSPEIGKGSWITWVEASRYDEGTAYVAVDRHMYGDMTAHVFKTTDYGKTWKSIMAADSGVRGWAHVIKEDLVSPNLLFLGTEFGLYISNDGRERWAQYKGSAFPAVAVDDLVVQPRTNDLVLATHGRGIWIIDDISPFRSLNPGIMQEEAGFLPIPKGTQWLEAFAGWPEGANSFNGPSRPDVSTIPYYQRTRHIFGDLKIEIFDAQGKVVDTVSSSKHRGVNRAEWSMHLKAPKVPPAASASFGAAFGPRILPGTYTVKMTKGDKTYESKVDVVLDPRVKFTDEDRKQQFDLATKISAMLNHMSGAVDSIIAVHDTANHDASGLKDRDALKQKLTKLAADSDTIRSKIVATKEGGAITGEERLREFLAGLYSDVNGYEGRPTDSQAERTEVLRRELEDVIGEFQKLVTPQLDSLNKQLTAKKLQPIRLIPEQEWQKAQDAVESGAATPSVLGMREMD